jgi:hypothetical protein
VKRQFIEQTASFPLRIVPSIVDENGAQSRPPKSGINVSQIKKKIFEWPRFFRNLNLSVLRHFAVVQRRLPVLRQWVDSFTIAAGTGNPAWNGGGKLANPIYWVMLYLLFF